MKCPSCNKFAQYDEPEVEINSSDISPDGTVSIEARLVLKSACCNDELKEWNPTLEGQAKIGAHTGEGHQLEVECDDGEGSDYYDNPGRPQRYRRHIYTISATAKVSCSCGKLDTTVEMKDEERASGMEELC